MLSSGWRTEQSPYRVAPRERRAGVKIRRTPVARGMSIKSKGVLDAMNDGRKRNASVRAQRKLLAMLEKIHG